MRSSIAFNMKYITKSIKLRQGNMKRKAKPFFEVGRNCSEFLTLPLHCHSSFLFT